MSDRKKKRKGASSSKISRKLEDHLFSDVTQRDRNRAVEEIIESSSPRKSFFLMVAISAALATMGIMENNVAVIIGGMLVAPMLSPILAVALGIETADNYLIKRSLKIIFWWALVALASSLFFALLLNEGQINRQQLNREILLRTEVNLSTILIALVAGFAASISLVRSELAKFMSGVAIAVALIPPLAVSAIGISILNFKVFYNALASFLINLIGIILAALVVFSLTRLSEAKRKIEMELKEEEMLTGDKS